MRIEWWAPLLYNGRDYRTYMSTTTRPAHPETAATGVPAVPLTVEGYSVLHQMMRIRWSAWRQLRASQKTDIVHEAVSVLGPEIEFGKSEAYQLEVDTSELVVI